MAKKPYNISIIDPDKYIIERGYLPVTSHAIYETSSTRFHPDGFFSEVIFGQIGTPERLIRRGYVELNTEIIQPHIYLNMITLKGFYQDIISGKSYAKYDPETKELINCDQDDPDADTGYAFFLSNYPRIVFPDTGSITRRDKIKLLEKYKSVTTIKRYLVLPAGIRDIRTDQDGKMIGEEDINKLYLGLLSLTLSLPSSNSSDPIYDGIRYNIQNKVNQIYQYIMNLLSGKGGFGQSKYAARSIAWSGRNIITAAAVSRVDSSESPNMFRSNECMVPLYQAMKQTVPLLTNRLKTIFMQQVFDDDSTTIAVIDPHTLSLVYREISGNQKNRYTTSDGLEQIVTSFRNPKIHKLPVVVHADDKKPYYLYLVYDRGDTIYFFRNVDDFKHLYTNADAYTIDPISDKLSVLDELSIDKKDVAIMGSSTLSIFGMNYYSRDLDIVVSEDVFSRLMKDERFSEQKNGVLRYEDKVDVYNQIVLRDEKFTEYKKKSTIDIDGWSITKPSEALTHYRKSDRPKDLAKINFLENIVVDDTLIRPLTYIEMMYLATYSGVSDKYCLTTRYPVLNLEGIRPFKIKLTSTDPSRTVSLKWADKSAPDQEAVILPNYPIMSLPCKGSMSVHPSTLSAYDGDHDGDQLSLHILMSNEATDELSSFMDSPISMVSTNGNLIYGLASSKLVSYSLYAATYHPVE